MNKIAEYLEIEKVAARAGDTIFFADASKGSSQKQLKRALNRIINKDIKKRILGSPNKFKIFAGITATIGGLAVINKKHKDSKNFLAAKRALRKNLNDPSLGNDPAFYKPAIIKGRNMLVVGGVGGAAAGRGIGKLFELLGRKGGKYSGAKIFGTVAGSFIGLLGGQIVGQESVKRDYLKGKGITITGLNNYKFTPEAKLKYMK